MGDVESRTLEKMSTKGSNVTLIVAGEIESAEMYGEENVFCEYSYVYGPDWKENGEKTSVVSQLSKKVSLLSLLWH